MAPVFSARAPWFGGDLQTIRNMLRPPRPLPDAGERLELPLRDGSGDRLAARLQMPRDRRRPLTVLIHGLSGGEDSPYLLVSAAALLARGHPVLRLNLRGAGASRPLCRFQYHAGRTADLADALAGLDPSLTDGGVFVVGYSLGGNLLLKFLGERGAAAPVRAAAAVSAPIDLAAAARRILMPRNRVYHWNLLRAMKAEALAPAAALAPSERLAIAAARHIVEFDDRFVAPRNGFAGAADYYARCSAEPFLPAIRVPTLVVHALDDPWIPPAAYRRVRWADTPHLYPALSPGGGHVGFHARGSRLPWHDQVVTEFFAERAAP
ncbi:alpha/beta fold hydrolase [bacterium]|nr:alpha/beta fold hydrolase [bacterium]